MLCCGIGRSRTKAPSKKPFDGKAFCDNVYNLGRAYRHRAIEVIKICQTLSTIAHGFEEETELTSVLETCDKLIKRAIESGKGTSEESTQAFEMVTRILKTHSQNFRHSNMTIDAAMEAAEKKDIANMRKWRKSSNDDTLIDVEFHILPTIPGKKPIIARQKLSTNSAKFVLPEILWNFGHYEDERCLRLTQKPHFYARLPKSHGGPEGQPTEDLRGTIYVLTNNLVPESGASRRVFFDFGGKTRAFDNFWDANNTLIFRDVIGRVESERAVEKPIPRKPKPQFEYHVGHKKSSPTLDNPEYTLNWTDPIRDLLEEEFSHTHVHIKAMKH